MQKLPKFGVLTNPSVDTLKEIKNIARLGFDFVEIGIEEPCATPQILLKQKDQILDLLSKYKMFTVGHTAYWVHFGSSHQKARRGWVAEAKDMIDVASKLKINFLNFHFYGGYGQTATFPAGVRKFVENFTESMNELNSFARKRGVVLMLENVPMQEKRFYGIKEFSYVIRNVPGLMIHLDIGHAFIEGGMKRIKKYIERFSNKIVHVHIHDNHGEEDEHLPVGKGLIDFVKVVKYLKKIGYDKTITFEIFTENREDTRKSMIKIKNLWKKF